MGALTFRQTALIVACFVAATFAWGLGFYSFGFYVSALQKVHGWPTSVLAGTVAVHALMTGATGIVVGRSLNRLGPRLVFLLGILAMALGSYAIGLLTVLPAQLAAWLILLPFALAGAGFAACSTSAITASLNLKFDKGLGLAMGVALSGASAGGAVMPPILAWLSQGYGYHVALALVSAAMALLVWPLVMLFVDGPAMVRAEGETEAGPAETPRIATLMRQLAFWRIAIAATLAMGAQVTLFMHLLPALEPGLGLVNASFAVSLAATAAVAGRLIVGYLSIRMTVYRLALACYLTQGLGIALIVLGGGVWLQYAGVAMAGLVVGAIVMVTPLMINHDLGKANFPISYGWMAAMMQSAAFITAITVGWLRDDTGGYLTGFLLLSAMHLCAAVVISLRRGS